MNDITITTAVTPADVAEVATLFRDYASGLPVDLAYQDFEAELAAMPGKYAPPKGVLLLARDSSGSPIGCVALRPMERQVACEMKRLYVARAGRGMGLGARLVEALVERARAAGYGEMWLDTLPTMSEAQALYRKLGFAVAAPYYTTPVVGTIFMRRKL